MRVSHRLGCRKLTHSQLRQPPRERLHTGHRPHRPAHEPFAVEGFTLLNQLCRLGRADPTAGKVPRDDFLRRGEFEVLGFDVPPPESAVGQGASNRRTRRVTGQGSIGCPPAPLAQGRAPFLNGLRPSLASLGGPHLPGFSLAAALSLEYGGNEQFQAYFERSLQRAPGANG
jgi:hypothetical protein